MAQYTYIDTRILLNLELVKRKESGAPAGT